MRPTSKHDSTHLPTYDGITGKEIRHRRHNGTVNWPLKISIMGEETFYMESEYCEFSSATMLAILIRSFPRALTEIWYV